ncbi:MAG: MBL fold metallo-hydrolase [Hydrogenophilales bacterium]|nr:MBL fold metallo-hydrolase [Hydrogenophilales bacterium]
MRFACLGSGSKGNAWLVESGATRVMLDCGFGVRDMSARLARLGLEMSDVTAVVLTHEHSDHVRGALPFARKAGCPVWATHGCLAMIEALDSIERVDVRYIDSHAAIAIGDLQLQSFPVPHDAREPVQFVASDGARRWGLLTDAGHVTEHMTAMLDGCDALAVECNHDLDKLRSGSYPASLKARILGRYGHLDNGAAAGLLAGIGRDRLQHVVAAHLSEENNTPALAREALAAVLGCRPDWVGVADQSAGLDWREIL